MRNGLFIDEDGTKCWFLNNQFHREDGPAIERSNGSKSWYQYGKYHRLDGPAIEYPNGSKYWWRHGKRHREDGPAVECGGYKEWYLDGKLYSQEEHARLVKLKAFW